MMQFLIDLEKAKAYYGRKAHTRRLPDGRIIEVRASSGTSKPATQPPKTVKTVKRKTTKKKAAKATKKTTRKKTTKTVAARPKKVTKKTIAKKPTPHKKIKPTALTVELLRKRYGIDIYAVGEGEKYEQVIPAVLKAIEGLSHVWALSRKHRCDVEVRDVYDGHNALYQWHNNTIAIDAQRGQQSFNHEFGHMVDYKVLGDAKSLREAHMELRSLLSNQLTLSETSRMEVGALSSIRMFIELGRDPESWVQEATPEHVQKLRKLVEKVMRKNVAAVAWLLAVENTAYARGLGNFTTARELSRETGISITEAVEHLRYLSEPAEMFARYFEQWCTVRLQEKGKNPEEYRARDTGTHSSWFFPEATFHELRPMFEQLVGKDVLKSLMNHVLVTCTPTLAKSFDMLATTAMTMGGQVKKIGEGKFGARQVIFSNGLKACLKPKNHSTELYRGVRRDAQHLHEVAAYQLDRQLLKFGVIPPAILSMYKGQQASIAQWVMGKYAKDFVPHVFNKTKADWKKRVALLATKVNADALRQLIIFDLIVNNTDRHAKNCLFVPFSNQVWGIDNGLAFGSQLRYYYNVFHRFLFQNRLELTKKERQRLGSITREQLQKVLGRYLTPVQIEETYWRLQWVLEHPNLGFWLVSEGQRGRDDFPDNKEWFRQKLRGEPQNRVIARIQGMGALVPA